MPRSTSLCCSISVRLALALALALGLVAAPTALLADELTSRLRAHVEYLASDELRGREPGTLGIQLAEQHVADVFSELGLLPVPGFHDYFLGFDLKRDSFDPDCTQVILNVGGARIDLAPNVDFRPFDFSGSGRVDTEIVFAGYGITAPEHGWDDYDGISVKGKVALVFRHEPREDDPSSPFDGAESSEHATFTAKAENARAHGAVGILIVTDPIHHDAADDLRWGGAMRLPPVEGSAAPNGIAPTDRDAEPQILAVQISKSIAQRLVHAAGRDLGELQLATDVGIPPAAVGKALAHIEFAVGHLPEPETICCTNVAAYLPEIGRAHV